MPASDLDLLTEAARAAGAIARRFFRASPGIWHKPGGAGPVTEADLEVNRMLHAELGAARPGYGWLSEETPDDPARLGTERTFIIDPIDGTRAFIEGDTSFAHSLAVAEDGRITAAVVYLPMKDMLYAATAAGPATLNGTPIRASVKTGAEGATLLTAKPNLASEHWKDGTPPPFQRKFRASLAWRLCLVAEGRYDAMLTLRPSWEWDIAAGDLIARQAGATVTDRKGLPLRFNAADPRTAGVIAAPAPLWTALRSALNA
ncbi:3'(2'),5'-bisphosphate nucleotidase CysQ [Defluviimonas salinarum]|uniref:3'(2'),5'-bisphosphate nucleotidase CysQ n=1 Tax=Defluviimonas salinarum TaxID=2992147 RepID=A0ABT3J809_9RHOB|nr:3'(2'),5'-bisphosphate nucleotidase CysQ [Defluviimonas salinarum]MCW3783828.1 3'(2'),5'-bisphosphate nucleotidase CysQ [Defluviimonas salinarum]